MFKKPPQVKAYHHSVQHQKQPRREVSRRLEERCNFARPLRCARGDEAFRDTDYCVASTQDHGVTKKDADHIESHNDSLFNPAAENKPQPLC